MAISAAARCFSAFAGEWQLEPRLGFAMSWQAYEAAKRAWIDANPGATPEQYAEAMRAIADRCGV